MKCPNCGAEVSGSVCNFCGSLLSAETTQKARCSNCGSTNITFKRENQGEIRGKNAKRIVHRTVGYCKDCGNTWYISEEAPKPRKTWLWVLGWIFIFPLPLTILLLRKKEMKPFIKYTIIAIAWIIYIIIAIAYKPSNKEESKDSASPTSASAKMETSGQAKETQTFVLKNGELGEYGIEVILNEGTEFEEREIAYHIPSGTYIVKNISGNNAGQISVYCSGPEKNGEWEEFVADENCAKPLVVMAGETKELEILEGQFVVLSDSSNDYQFTLK